MGKIIKVSAFLLLIISTAVASPKNTYAATGNRDGCYVTEFVYDTESDGGLWECVELHLNCPNGHGGLIVTVLSQNCTVWG